MGLCWPKLCSSCPLCLSHLRSCCNEETLIIQPSDFNLYQTSSTLSHGVGFKYCFAASSWGWPWALGDPVITRVAHVISSQLCICDTCFRPPPPSLLPHLACYLFSKSLPSLSLWKECSPPSPTSHSVQNKAASQHCDFLLSC